MTGYKTVQTQRRYEKKIIGKWSKRERILARILNTDKDKDSGTVDQRVRCKSTGKTR